MSDFSLGIPNYRNWPEASLEDISNVLRRGTAPSYVPESSVRVIGQRCVQDSGFRADKARPHDPNLTERSFIAEPGDVLVNSTGSGTIGRSCVFRSNGVFVVDSHVTVIRPREGIDPEWINLMLRSPWGQRRLESHCFAGSTNQIELSRLELARTMIPVPSWGVQRKIVALLSSLSEAERGIDASIAKLRSVSEGMSSEITADLAKRPLGCVGDFFDIGAGVTIDPGRVPKRETATYLRVANVQRGFIDLSALARVEKFPGDEAKYALREGDLLVVEGHANPREIGRCALVANGSVGHLHQNHLFRLRSANVIAEFSQFWLNSEHVRSYWRRAAATSSGLYTISRAVVENAPFPILRTGEQKGILARMGSFSEKIRSNVEELAKLRLLKAGLVDDLLSGRVAVSVADG